MPKNKRNHYIPKGVIKRFLNEGDGLILLDTVSFQLLPVKNPKSAFYEDYLYARWSADGERDSSAELALQIESENSLPDHIDRVIAAIDRSQFENADVDVKRFFAEYLVRLFFRNPRTIRDLRKAFKGKFAFALLRLGLAIRDLGKQNSARQRYGAERMATGEMAYLLATKDISKITDEFMERGIHFHVPIKSAPSFLLGSQGVFIWATPTSRYVSQKSKKWAPIEHFLVLDPRLMVSFRGQEDSRGPVWLGKKRINAINSEIARVSKEVVAHRRSDLDEVGFVIYGDEKDLIDWKGIERT